MFLMLIWNQAKEYLIIVCFKYFLAWFQINIKNILSYLFSYIHKISQLYVHWFYILKTFSSDINKILIKDLHWIVIWNRDIYIAHIRSISDYIFKMLFVPFLCNRWMDSAETFRKCSLGSLVLYLTKILTVHGQ